MTTYSSKTLKLRNARLSYTYLLLQAFQQLLGSLHQQNARQHRPGLAKRVSHSPLCFLAIATPAALQATVH